MYIAPHGAWRSLVARLLWEQDVGGSNPLAPTELSPRGPAAAMWLIVAQPGSSGFFAQSNVRASASVGKTPFDVDETFDSVDE